MTRNDGVRVAIAERAWEIAGELVEADAREAGDLERALAVVARLGDEGPVARSDAATGYTSERLLAHALAIQSDVIDEMSGMCNDAVQQLGALLHTPLGTLARRLVAAADAGDHDQLHEAIEAIRRQVGRVTVSAEPRFDDVEISALTTRGLEQYLARLEEGLASAAMDPFFHRAYQLRIAEVRAAAQRCVAVRNRRATEQFDAGGE